MAAGHRLADLRDGYTIAQVQFFARAMAWNREQEKLDRAEAVALGILEAFNPAEKIISGLRQILADPEKIQEPAPAELKPEVMASLFGGLPLAE